MARLLRCLHILSITPNGVTLRELSRRLKVDERTIRRYLEIFRKSGFEPIVVGNTKAGANKWFVRW